MKSEPAPLIIIGAGEHARVVADAVSLLPDQWSLAGIVAPDGEALAASYGVPWLASDAEAFATLPQCLVILGVGQVGVGSLRARLVKAYDAAGARWAAVVHPSAIISRSARLAEGAVVLAGAVINPGAQIGSHAIINSRAVIEHNCTLGPFVCIAPGAVLGGGVQVGAGAFIGLGACVRDHLNVGPNACAGMGAVVVRDVKEATTVLGIPAREHHLEPHS